MTKLRAASLRLLCLLFGHQWGRYRRRTLKDSEGKVVTQGKTFSVCTRCLARHDGWKRQDPPRWNCRSPAPRQ